MNSFIFAVIALILAIFMFSSMVIGLTVEAIKYEKEKKKKLGRKRVKAQP
jgi:hypothetical protein